MTHDALVKWAERWLRKRRAVVVLSDVRSIMVSEQPDVIAWGNSGFSTLVECKVSRADFLRDAGKPFRRHPERGMGLERWYAAPPGLLTVADLPARWGLIEPADRGGAPVGVRVVRRAERFDRRAEREERALLVTALRRATEGWGRAMFGDLAPPAETEGDRHPAVLARTIRNLRAELREARRDRDRVLAKLARLEAMA